MGFDIKTINPTVEKRAREIANSLHRRLFLENPIDLRLAHRQIHQLVVGPLLVEARCVVGQRVPTRARLLRIRAGESAVR